MIYSRITIFRVKKDSDTGRNEYNAVRGKKEKEKRKGVKKTPHELSLKINEKIGNPRVTAWKKENQYFSQFTWAIQNP